MRTPPPAFLPLGRGVRGGVLVFIAVSVGAGASGWGAGLERLERPPDSRSVYAYDGRSESLVDSQILSGDG